LFYIPLPAKISISFFAQLRPLEARTVKSPDDKLLDADHKCRHAMPKDFELAT
jgi:hypothetical protein